MLQSLFFSPILFHDTELRNWLEMSPICRYSAESGYANDVHLVRLGKPPLGGADLVFTEAGAVEKASRIKRGDFGLWQDRQIGPPRRIADFLRERGVRRWRYDSHTSAAKQGRRPWGSNGSTSKVSCTTGEKPWLVGAPSAISVAKGWRMPPELSVQELGDLKHVSRRATIRAIDAGVSALELHSAHGYLLHEFMLPLSNRRYNPYGGSRVARIRFQVEMVDRVREVGPRCDPLSVRIFGADGIDGGWTRDDRIVYARELAKRGADVVDCALDGLASSATDIKVPRAPGFQIPLAGKVRRAAGVARIAAGLVLNATQAEPTLRHGDADLVAIVREAHYDSTWPLHAEEPIGADAGFTAWPQQHELSKYYIQSIRGA